MMEGSLRKKVFNGCPRDEVVENNDGGDKSMKFGLIYEINSHGGSREILVLVSTMQQFLPRAMIEIQGTLYKLWDFMLGLECITQI